MHIVLMTHHWLATKQLLKDSDRNMVTLDTLETLQENHSYNWYRPHGDANQAAS
jgi:hypothetical protein